MLDNCEHVIESAGRLADAILRTCPGVRVMRRVAGPRARRRAHLPSALARCRDRLRDLTAITGSDAVRLFEDRARAARSGFAVDATNATPCGEICRRLDGIPLRRARGRANRRHEPGRDRVVARRAVPPAHRRPAGFARTPPDVARDRRMVVLAPRAGRANRVRPAGGVLRLRRGGRPGRDLG